MTEQRKMTRPMQVIGPDGELMTLADLPPPETRRWVIRRKAKVVAAVRGGLISLEEACQRYRLSVEEFLGWQRMIERHGVPGLRVTRIQHYRAADTWTTLPRARHEPGRGTIRVAARPAAASIRSSKPQNR